MEPADQNLDKKKSEFISIAAHQLRTPLSTLRWAHQMLLDEELGPLNEDQRTVLLQSKLSIDRMSSMVADLLSADHLEFDQIEYDMKPLNFTMLLRECVDELSEFASSHHVTVALHQPDHRVEVVGDPHKLKEVILNLLNNAIKYSPHSSTVTISLTDGNEEVRVQFADRGIGIPEKDQSSIFLKFSRSDNAKKIDADGSGLGLFIAKRITEAHSGTISFTSKEGVGTTFTVTLPKSK